MERKVVGYVRTSTEDQDISLSAQQAKVECMAGMRDWTIGELIVEQVSAKSLERPGVKRLIAMVAAGEVAVVIIAKLDRLTRSLRDLQDLLDLFSKHDVALVSVAESLDTGSAVGRMILNILGVFAQFEREQLGERTQIALRHQKARAKVYCSHTPFGYIRDGSKLVTHEDEQAIVRRIFGWKAAGESLLGIARRLNDAGVPTKENGRWHASTVKAILGNSIHESASRAASQITADVVSALVNLGCQRQEASGLAVGIDPGLDFDQALRQALAARNQQAQVSGFMA
jgi:site-specific DNA recombinase